MSSVFVFRDYTIGHVTYSKLALQEYLPLGGVPDGDLTEEKEWRVSPAHWVWAAFTQDSVLR